MLPGEKVTVEGQNPPDLGIAKGLGVNGGNPWVPAPRWQEGLCGPQSSRLCFCLTDLPATCWARLSPVKLHRYQEKLPSSLGLSKAMSLSSQSEENAQYFYDTKAVAG